MVSRTQPHMMRQQGRSSGGSRQAPHGSRVLLGALLLVVCLGTVPQQAAARSTIKLRGSNLTIASEAVEPLPEDINALSALQFSVAQGGVGLYERADYASAYVDPTTLELVGGVNPFESFATVEANNSLILVNSTTNYQALDVLLVANNTLQVSGPDARLALNRSALRAVTGNWLLLSNGSSLALNNSALSMSNYFTLYSDSSTISLNGSVMAFKDVGIWLNATNLSLRQATWNVTTGRAPAPARYTGKVSPVIAITSSNVDLAVTSWLLRDIPLLHLDSVALSLTNSTITLYNTTAHVYASSLILSTSEIILYNSSLVVLANTSSVSAQPVNAFKLYRNDTQSYNPALAAYAGRNTTTNDTSAPDLSPLVGVPWGSVDLQLVNADADFQFLDQADAVAAAPTQPSSTATGVTGGTTAP